MLLRTCVLVRARQNHPSLRSHHSASLLQNPSADATCGDCTTDCSANTDNTKCCETAPGVYSCVVGPPVFFLSPHPAVLKGSQHAPCPGAAAPIRRCGAPCCCAPVCWCVHDKITPHSVPLPPHNDLPTCRAAAPPPTARVPRRAATRPAPAWYVLPGCCPGGRSERSPALIIRQVG